MTTCSIDGCGQPSRSRQGWCSTHYKRWKRHGDPEALIRPKVHDEPCAVEGCTERSWSKGWCSKHYQRWRKYGDPLAAGYIRSDDEARFWSYVDRRGDDECWPWLGRINKWGYGQFRLPDGYVRAHRFAYELMVGPIPAEMTIDHVKARGCIRKDCMNAPAHMEPVTYQENNLRSGNQAALNARKTHCPQDHEYTPENTYIIPSTGARVCRTCQREHSRQTAARRRARLKAAARR